MSFNFAPATKGTEIAYLFPGQGTQAAGMGKEIYDSSPAARSIFDEVDEALERPLTDLLFSGPDEALRETANAQPAVMAMSLACMAAMEEHLNSDMALNPAFLAGHSLGEYTALAVAGVLGIGETAQLVQERGRLMQEACEQMPGSMAAVIGLDEMTIGEIVRETGTYVSNVNTPLQIVISGEKMAVARALDMAQARGARKVIPLRVGGAFHSALMEPAQEGLIEVVDALPFVDPTVPIVANSSGRPLATADEIKQELIVQISSCVQWNRSMDFMIGSGICRFVEIGPGRALSSMVKRIDGSAEAISVGDLESIANLSRN